MPHYKSPDNALHYIESEYAYLLPAGSIQISDAEADIIRQEDAYIPPVVSMRQARLALLQQGHLATVNAAIAAGGQADQISWEYATEVNRADPLVASMALVLDLDSQELDTLFTLAASL